jgi:ankyrin repeat protein
MRSAAQSIHRMETNSDGSNQAVIAAVRRGDLGELRRIVTSDPSRARACEPRGVSAVLLAVYENQDDAIRLLLEHKPDVDVFEAAAIGLTDALDHILTRDHRMVHAWSGDGFTPLHLAAHFNRAEAVDALLRADADVTAVSRNSLAVMPLHSVVAGKAYRPARLLLEAGAPPNATQAGGWFAVLSAAQHGDKELIRLLVEFGAELCVNASGKSAAEVAAEAGHDDLAGWIVDRCQKGQTR